VRDSLNKAYYARTRSRGFFAALRPLCFFRVEAAYAAYRDDGFRGLTGFAGGFPMPRMNDPI
jgi:hypothetical protein